MPRISLEKARIESIDENRLIYRCKECGQIWSPNIQTGGRIPRGWWRCPNGCNADAYGSTKSKI